MIAIIDYDAGNIKSVEKALQKLGEETCITRDKNILLRADKVILPGVGAFGSAMEKIHTYGLYDVIHEIVRKGTPFLGICLGMQMAVVEFARNVLGLKDANSAEFSEETKNKVMKIIDEYADMINKILYRKLRNNED